MKKLEDIKAKLADALAHARAIDATASASERRAASEVVEALQRESILHITDGAKLCPFCKAVPVGIEQPNGSGGSEFEIGCSFCPPFVHSDGTTRKVRVRGGMLPRHAVDAWNEGPSAWVKVSA